ncbi:uncharacterized protein LOC132194717 [Neocloeon triangulifer]|uniref:uncharacterized protein LOC132194717 n=1 Tax=Neocloeon triangulifer TaxID=2078957 RepID=UPI00286F6210|nr:uncharacterized protein LOC132194717 [Neocloeon triangulifer]
MTAPWERIFRQEMLLRPTLPVLKVNPEELREMGNKFFKSGDYWNAISFYTKSLAKAAAGSKERGLAYANRSAVLLSLGYYDECISDAKIALQNKYPDNLAHKLHMRMATCCKALGREVEAQENLQAAIETVKKQNMIPEVKEETVKGFQKQLADNHNSVMPNLRVEHLAAPCPSYGPNPENPLVSAAVTIRQKGQHSTFFANRKINTGDVLIVEKPILSLSSCLESGGDQTWIHCCHCLKLCLNLQPCPTCKWACYCSEECATAAWNKYHKHECVKKNKIAENIIKQGGIQRKGDNILCVHLSFAAIATFGLENCINAIQNDKFSDGASEELRDFLNLKVRNIGNRSAINVACTNGMGLVADSCGVSGEKKLALVKFLEKAMQILFSNFVPIADVSLLRFNDEIVVDKDYHNIGCGLYPVASLLKSHCDPNTVQVFHQKTMVILAGRPIEKGEEIVMLRDINYALVPLQARRLYYSLTNCPSYVCRCRACSEDWPVLEEQEACHNFMARNPEFRGHLQKQYRRNITAHATNYKSLSLFTPENFKLSVKIQELYRQQRRDDLQFNATFDFVVNYLNVKTKKFFTSGSCVEPSKKLGHSIPRRIM